MPAQNTRKVELGDTTTYLRTEDAQILELLGEGVEAQRQIAEATEALSKVKEKLLAIAERERGGREQGTMRLYSPDGRFAKVVWERSIQVDPAIAEELRKQLGKSWDDVFVEKLTFGRARSYAAFMDKDQGPLERLKGKIEKACKTIERKPSVRLFDAGESER